MTNKKVTTLVALIALMASVIGGFIVYAALSQTLNITGSAEFQPESWAVKFKASSLSAPTLTGGATIAEGFAPTLSDTSIGNYKVVLVQPGSSATYTFTIENTGTLDAKLTTYSPTNPSCTGTAPTAVADQDIVCSSNLSYTLKYVGGDLTENSLTSGTAVAQGQLLKAGTEVQVELKLEFSSLATQLPTNPVTIGGLNRSLIYSVNE